MYKMIHKLTNEIIFTPFTTIVLPSLSHYKWGESSVIQKRPDILWLKLNAKTYTNTHQKNRSDQSDWAFGCVAQVPNIPVVN